MYESAMAARTEHQARERAYVRAGGDPELAWLAEVLQYRVRGPVARAAEWAASGLGSVRPDRRTVRPGLDRRSPACPRAPSRGWRGRRRSPDDARSARRAAPRG